EFAMSEIEAKAKRDTTDGDPDTVESAARTRRDTAGPRTRVIPVLITLATIALAVPLGWLTWNAYMGAPWTRDGTVRAYVVTITPEVAGRIVQLPVADNQFVHKGDMLMTIDPTDYAIAVDLAQAAVDQAVANAQNAEREAERRAR